ncbi:hypothetical protein KKF34_07380 [Myxococcota bacterium]|nr:hypothetical protein [Myxococcota bacterium]MBU1382875.1 hypothetical protein [Myxococcota bacterium]MBU1496681.1 hypothetical protein [Myxococcota bacterium]
MKYIALFPIVFAMPIKTFLKSDGIRDAFKHHVRLRGRLVQKTDIPLLVQFPEGRETILGTAFDFLMRFYLKRQNPAAWSGLWFCEGKYIHNEDLKGIIPEARRQFYKYLLTGKLSEELLKAAFQLAQVEMTYRGAGIEIIDSTPEDHSVLRSMMDLLSPDLFPVSKVCVLNPEFGMGTVIAREADADFFIDDTLWEIKSVKDFNKTGDYFRQLLGYTILCEAGRMTIRGRRRRFNEVEPSPKITHVGVYYSRHRFKERYALTDLVKNWDALLYECLDVMNSNARLARSEFPGYDSYTCDNDRKCKDMSGFVDEKPFETLKEAAMDDFDRYVLPWAERVARKLY